VRTGKVTKGNEHKESGQDHEDEVQLNRLLSCQGQRVVVSNQRWNSCTLRHQGHGMIGLLRHIRGFQPMIDGWSHGSTS